jgi:hypothetical protein
MQPFFAVAVPRTEATEFRLQMITFERDPQMTQIEEKVRFICDWTF